MRYFIYLTILIVLLLAEPVNAQPYIDLVNIQYTVFNQAPMKKDMNARVDHSAWSGGFFLPLPLKNDNRFIIGGEHSTFNVNYSGNDTRVSSVLQTTALQLGLLKQWKNKKWNSIFLLIPRLAADFKNTVSKDWQMGGAVITTYAWKKDIKLKAGLYYNSEFFGNYFMPLLGLDWKVNQRLRGWGLLPGSLNVEYTLSSRVSCGLRYQSITATYRPEGNDGSTYIREGDVFWSDQQLSLKSDVNLTKNLVIYAGIGMTGFHYFQAFDKFHRETVSLPQFQVSRDRGFLYAGLAFRVKTE